MLCSVVKCSVFTGGCSWNCYKPSRLARFWQGAQSQAPATRNDIWTSKNGLNLPNFDTFELEMCFGRQRRALFEHRNFQRWSEPLNFFKFLHVLTSKDMCFAPQWRALFRHLNFQKWSKCGVFCTCWLGNMLRATTVFNFSSLVWPHGSAPSALASRLFDLPEPQIIGKMLWVAAFLSFRVPASSFFSLFLLSDLLSSFLVLFDSSTSAFPSVYCRKFDF